MRYRNRSKNFSVIAAIPALLPAAVFFIVWEWFKLLPRLPDSDRSFNTAISIAALYGITLLLIALAGFGLQAIIRKQIANGVITRLCRAGYPCRTCQITLIVLTCVCAGVLIQFFRIRFHDPRMIAWSLFIIIGTMVWLTTCAVVVLEKNRRQNEPHKDRFSNLSLFEKLKHPLILPAYILILAFLINLEWLRYVLDLPGLAIIAIWIASSIELSKVLQRVPGISKIITALFAAFLLVAMISVFPLSNQTAINLRNHSVIPRYILKCVPKLQSQAHNPASSLSSETDTKTPDFVLPGEFDHQSWNLQNRQDFPYLNLSARELHGSGAGWNVILLSVDALRSDHLSCYGYPLNTSPNLDSLAAAGVMFLRHTTQGGDSIYSLNSMLSGMLPWTFNNLQNPMISRILSDAGIKTIYVGYDYVLKGGAFRQNFDIMDLLEGSRQDVWGNKTSDILIDRIIRQIEKQDTGSFFIYSHLLDPHADYLENDLTQQFKSSQHMHYDGEIAFTDRHIGRLVEYLKETNLYDHTLLIITADHGEAFNEHGHLWHGKFLYEESVRTPLIMTLPNVPGRQVKIPLGPVHIVPTILDFLGVQSATAMDGVSLLPLIYNGDVSDIPVLEIYIPRENYSKRATIYGPWKYIENHRDNSQELYHLFDDPGETNNLL